MKNYLNVNKVFFQEKTYTMHEICFLLFVLLCFPWGEGSVLKLYNLEVLKEKSGFKYMANEGWKCKREIDF